MRSQKLTTGTFECADRWRYRLRREKREEANAQYQVCRPLGACRRSLLLACIGPRASSRNGINMRNRDWRLSEHQVGLFGYVNHARACARESTQRARSGMP